MAPQLTEDSIASETLEVLLMVGDSAWKAKDLAASRRAYELALTFDRCNVVALNRLGRISLIEKDPSAAAIRFATSMSIKTDAATCVNMSIALTRLGEFAEALVVCNEAIDHNGKFLPAHIQKAAILERLGADSDAEYAIREAVERFPDSQNLLHALSHHELRRGDFENGWRHYESRQPRLDLVTKLDEYPEWEGESLSHALILVCGEQGIGDQIMWARYLPLLRELKAEVVLFTRPELARLFAHSFALSKIRIITSDRELAGLEPDCWVAMGSLPLRWSQFENAKPVSMPAMKGCVLPYLFAAGPDIDRFAALIPRTGRLRVGLCWRGNPEHAKDRERTIPFETLRPLLEIEGIDFYSLQSGDQESGLPRLIDYCHDFGDTAAAIANLDLVISVDTSVLHLAGAMGRRGRGVRGLLGKAADWRWGRMCRRSTSWYPSARLYRCGDWDSVIADLCSDLPTARDMYVAEEKNDRRQGIECLPIRHSQVVTRQCRYGTMSWYRNDTYIGRALDLYGEYSESEVDLFRKILKAGDVVIEAGANVGALTVAFANIVGPNGHVWAFEPQRAYSELLRRNFVPPLFGGVIFWALGAERRNITLHSTPLDRVHAPGWDDSAGATYEVQQATLDSFEFPRVSLIKIDVDGQELEILEGADRTIAQSRPLIYVEYDKPGRYQDLLPWLHARGYRLYQHEAPLFNPANFNGNRVNVFGSIVSLMILAVPDENKEFHPVDWGLKRIRMENAE